MGSSKENDKEAPPPYSAHLIPSSSHLPAPAYNASQASPLSPPVIDRDTLLPSTFRVGPRDVAPFVSVPEMILHLRLLAAFDRLQQLVRTTQESTGEVLDEDTRWSVFCTRAEKRFESWVEEMERDGVDDAKQLDEGKRWPALDVLMVWHSYALNPRKFYEDAQREMMARRVRQLGFSLELVTRFIDPLTFDYNPPRREKELPASASLPFPTDPGLSTFELACPQCSTMNHHVPWLRPPGTPQGYCQKAFKHLCEGAYCGLFITHEKLRVFKVCQDLVAVFNGQQKFLPGLGLMPTTGEMTDAEAETVSWAIVTVFKLAFDKAMAKRSAAWKPKPIVVDATTGSPFSPSNLAKHVLHWSFEMFELVLHDALTDGVVANLCTGVRLRKIAFRHRMSRMYAAYDHAGVASLALGPAVMRQANFIDKMKSMGWLQPGRFEGGEGRAFLLQKAGARYHAFLDLMCSMPSGFLCPTLDIDLAWHTHQLKAEQYRLDALRITSPITRFIDHDDKVSDVKLGDAYDLTSRAWLARFKVPYSQCGCHQGDLAAIDDGLVAKVPDKLKFWNRGKGDNKTEVRRRAIEKVIEEMEQGEKDASHPSVHNLVSVNIRANEPHKAMRLYNIKKLDRQGETLHTTFPASDKDWRLKRALTKDPQHLDPFVQDLPTLAYMRKKVAMAVQYSAGEAARGGAVGSFTTTTQAGMPYWGIAAGEVLASGAADPAAWGLTVHDPHEMMERDCQRGACAAGVGAGGGGYCGAGGIGACANGGGAGGGGCATGASGACSNGGGGGGGARCVVGGIVGVCGGGGCGGGGCGGGGS